MPFGAAARDAGGRGRGMDVCGWVGGWVGVYGRSEVNMFLLGLKATEKRE